MIKHPLGTLTTRTINDIESINDIFSDGLIPILEISFPSFLNPRFYVLGELGDLHL